MGGFVKLWHFDKHFAKNTKKTRLSREMFWIFFLLDNNYFWNRNLEVKDEHNQGIFFPFFFFFGF